MLEEDPEFGHRSPVYHLHQLRNMHIVIALERLVGHVTLMSEFFEDILGVLMALVATE